MDKIVEPYFYRVDILVPFPILLTRLRCYGRVFPKQNEVVQVAHVLVKRGQYYICHFKSLLWIDGVMQQSAITERDCDELRGALKMLVDSEIVRPHSRIHPPANLAPHVKDTYADGNHWQYVFKYTFKKSH